MHGWPGLSQSCKPRYFPNEKCLGKPQVLISAWGKALTASRDCGLHMQRTTQMMVVDEYIHTVAARRNGVMGLSSGAFSCFLLCLEGKVAVPLTTSRRASLAEKLAVRKTRFVWCEGVDGVVIVAVAIAIAIPVYRLLAVFLHKKITCNMFMFCSSVGRFVRAKKKVKENDAIRIRLGMYKSNNSGRKGEVRIRSLPGVLG